MFGFIKKLFGAGTETVQSAQEMTEQAMDQSREAVSQVTSNVIDISQKAVEASLEGARVVEKTMVDNLADAQTMVTDTVAKSEAMVGKAVEQAQQTVSDFPENVVKAQEAATEVVSDVAETVVSNVAAAAAAGVTAASVVSDMGAATLTGTPELSQPVEFLDRDEFVLPRSSLIAKAMADIGAQSGVAAVSRGLRVYEYSLASAYAYDLRVDRELVALAALFAQTGDGAGPRAQSFCVAGGMWEALAEKVKDVILQSEAGANSDILETRALALGIMAEKSGGSVAFINGATSAQTIKQHAA